MNPKDVPKAKAYSPKPRPCLPKLLASHISATWQRNRRRHGRALHVPKWKRAAGVGVPSLDLRRESHEHRKLAKLVLLPRLLKPFW